MLDTPTFLGIWNMGFIQGTGREHETNVGYNANAFI